MNAHRSGRDAMASRDVADRRSEQVRVLARGQVTTRKGQDFGLGHALTGGTDLPVLVGAPGNRAPVIRLQPT